MTRAIYLAALSSAACVVHAGTIFESTDPTAPPLVLGGTMLTNVADPLRTGTSGEVRDITQRFSSVQTGDVALPATAIGNPFSLSVDYLVPSNTDLSADSQIYLQVNLDGANRGSVGFASVANTTPDVWNTLTLNNLGFPAGDPTNGPNIPAGTAAISGSLIIVDGGFGGSATFPDTGGLAILMDNFRIEAETIPEPATVGLTALMLCGGLLSRRTA